MTTTDDIAVRLAGLTTDPADEAPDTVADLVAQALARADADGLVDVAWAVEDTPIGPLTLAATGSGVVKIAFGADESALDELAAIVSPRLVRLPRRLDALRRELDEYFAGRRRDFDVALDRRLSHGYRLAVLEELSRVPFGDDRHLQGPGPAHRAPQGQPGGGHGHGDQPDPDRRALPPRAAHGRRPRGLRRGPRHQGVVAAPRGRAVELRRRVRRRSAGHVVGVAPDGQLLLVPVDHPVAIHRHADRNEGEEQEEPSHACRVR